MNDYNERLAMAKSRVRQGEKVESKLRSARRLMGQMQQKRAQLQETLAKEQADVDALEGFSLVGWIHAIRGNKEEKLDQERAELVAAKLKWDQAASAIEDLSADIERLTEEQSRWQDANAVYETILAEKEKALSESGGAIAEQMADLTERIGDLGNDQEELDEAIETGQSALGELAELQGTLESAVNWGTLDMFGGGMLTTMAKHAKIDSAKDQARQVQRALLQFEEELADTEERFEVSFQIDGFSKFADFFFDGLIADWIVQSKIRAAKDQCDQTHANVKSAIEECQDRLESVRNEIETLVKQRRNLIETS